VAYVDMIILSDNRWKGQIAAFFGKKSCSVSGGERNERRSKQVDSIALRRDRKLRSSTFGKLDKPT
jgi:hypothetical protein